MKAVVQRVKNASITANGAISGSITHGLLVYLGVAAEDSEKDAEWMAEKVAFLRIFADSGGKMNLSLKDLEDSAEIPDSAVKPGVLAVSQFTLLGDAGKGRRPFFGAAAEPEKAKALYEHFMEKIRKQGLQCESGVFQAYMDVSYTNDGPVTILLDSKS